MVYIRSLSESPTRKSDEFEANRMKLLEARPEKARRPRSPKANMLLILVNAVYLEMLSPLGKFFLQMG